MYTVVPTRWARRLLLEVFLADQNYRAPARRSMPTKTGLNILFRIFAQLVALWVAVVYAMSSRLVQNPQASLIVSSSLSHEGATSADQHGSVSRHHRHYSCNA